MTDIVENGVRYRPIDPAKRGRHATFESALAAALKDLTTERNPFYDSVVDNWDRLFPKLPARPGRCADGVICLYVTRASTSYLVRPKLPQIRRVLATLPGAPKTISLRVEIHAR